MTAWEDLVKEAGARFAVAPINTPLAVPTTWTEVRAAYLDDMPALAAPVFDEGPVGPEEAEDAFWEAQTSSWRSRWMLGAPDAPVAQSFGDYAAADVAMTEDLFKPKEPLAEKDGVDYVTVYRVEHSRTGEGPYNGGSYALSDMAWAHCDESHPNLWNAFDDPYAVTRGHYFAFESLDDLRWWFEGWEGPLDRRGFAVSVYRAPASSVITGRKQCVFEKDEAALVSRTPLV